jgi:hypothetical protein
LRWIEQEKLYWRIYNMKRSSNFFLFLLYFVSNPFKFFNFVHEKYTWKKVKWKMKKKKMRNSCMKENLWEGMVWREIGWGWLNGMKKWE